MQTKDFHDIVSRDLWNRLNFIRKTGNISAHNSGKISADQAELCLENLFYFMDFIQYCYGNTYEDKVFDASMLAKTPMERGVANPTVKDIDFDELIKENQELRKELATKREGRLYTDTKSTPRIAISVDMLDN